MFTQIYMFLCIDTYVYVYIYMYIHMFMYKYIPSRSSTFRTSGALRGARP